MAANLELREAFLAELRLKMAALDTEMSKLLAAEEASTITAADACERFLQITTKRGELGRKWLNASYGLDRDAGNA